MTTMFDAARAYRAAGLHPIPCEPRGKRSLVSWKEFQERQPTEEEISYWWGAQWPDANIALVLGRGLLAVDIDSFEGRENLTRAGVELPTDAPIVATGKGAHVYLAGTAGDRVGLVPGVDIRGVGYVVAPPSVHPSGRVYTWVTPFTTPPPAPPSLLTLLGAPNSGTSVPAAGTDWFAEAMAGVAEGGRDATCTRLAGFLLGQGLSPDRALAILRPWAACCTPPFPEDQVEKCVESIAKREAGDAAPGSLPQSAADLIEPTLALIARPIQNLRSTGLSVIDALLEGGLEPGTVTLLGGRPGTGKTALKSQVSTHVASQGVGVLFVSAEMGATRIMRRIFSQVSQVKFKHLKQGDLVDGEKIALQIAAEKIRTLPLWIETRVRTVEAIDALLGEMDSVGLVVIDYLQRLASPKHDDLRASVEHVSKTLSKVAISRNLPFLVASSLTRPDRAARDWRPSLTNLRESGALESDADNVILLYRDEGSNVLEVNVAKQRDGAVGQTVLHFHGETLSFKETA